VRSTRYTCEAGAREDCEDRGYSMRTEKPSRTRGVPRRVDDPGALGVAGGPRIRAGTERDRASRCLGDPGGASIEKCCSFEAR